MRTRLRVLLCVCVRARANVRVFLCTCHVSLAFFAVTAGVYVCARVHKLRLFTSRPVRAHLPTEQKVIGYVRVCERYITWPKKKGESHWITQCVWRVCVFLVVTCGKIDCVYGVFKIEKFTGVFTEGNVLANSENAYDFTGRISVGSEVK